MEDKDWVPADDAFPPAAPAALAAPTAHLHVAGQAEVRFGPPVGHTCLTSKLALAIACFSLDWLVARLDVGGLSHVFVVKGCDINLQRTNPPRQPYFIITALHIALD